MRNARTIAVLGAVLLGAVVASYGMRCRSGAQLVGRDASDEHRHAEMRSAPTVPFADMRTLNLGQRPGASLDARTAVSRAPLAVSAKADRLNDEEGRSDAGDPLRDVVELMHPLVDGCLEEAHAREPAMHGVIALSITTALGANGRFEIQSVVPGEADTLSTPSLLACVRDRAFGLELEAVPNLRFDIGRGVGSNEGAR